MHDLVREMAMWIATDLGKNKEKCIVQARARLREIPKVKNWKDVRRISLTRNDIAVISESPDCPQVTTLLLQYNKLVEELPFGIYSLKLLTHLNFEGTRFLKSLDGISGLSSLKTLKLRHSKVLLDMSLMKELQLLQHIEYITVSISPRTLVGEKLFYDPKMGRCIQKVSIYNERGGRRVSKSNSFASFGRSLLHLHRRLWNVGGDKDREDTMEQKPDKSMLLKPHNWRLEEIISKEKAASVLENNIIPFKKLEKLSLMTLPELKSIYWNALPFQCLRYLAIMNDCPKLRKLPLNSESVFDAKRDDVQRKVDREEFTGHRRRLAQVQVWLTSILTMENQYNELLKTSDVELERLCLCRLCSKNVKKSYLYGKRVMVMLREVESLSSQGEFDAVTDETPIGEGEELPIQHTIVGQETMLEMINNRFSKRGGGFDVVIWVVVSQNATVHKIQGSIGEKLGLLGKEWEEKSEMKRGQDIHNVLRKKKFVLFLDDIWEKVSLDVIGVRYPNRVNGCKVAFTTRSREVCGRMGVDDPIEVCCLHTDKAWDLFKKKVGENTLASHRDIPELARKVAGKCRGLPLALNVIGETMASKRSVQEWHRAIQVLTSYAAEFSGVEDKILPILKYSYDSLDGEMTKSCFLKMITRTFVKMHDVVREMAMWIPSDLGKNKERCIVQAGARIRELPKVKNWKDVRRISLMENDIQIISVSPDCPQLTTLLLQRNYLVEISDGFFQSMPKLLVLDLSLNRLSGFRMDMYNLVSLRYLNLSRTYIVNLPFGLYQLKMLTHLNLEKTRYLESLEGISELSSLRTLKLLDSKVRPDMSLMKELQLLQHIEYVSVGISSSTLVGETLFDDSRMGRCIQQVGIDEKEPVKVLVLPALDGLHDIFIQFCRMLEEIKIEKTPWNKSLTSPCFSNLTQVEILSCNGLKDLTWLLFAPKLTHLRVAGSVQLENIISKEKAESVLEDYIIPFHKLEVLVLDDLPELESIYWNALPFQRLRWLHILNGCPKLRKLPLNSKSVVNVEEFVISCPDEECLERVEWEDEATRLRFLPS
ncbi:hypothetical protein F2Q68_00042415, partial [Brassica cretica]